MAVLGVDHVAIVVHKENLDAVAARWSEVLGVDFDEMDQERLGIRVFIDLDAGIELIAPNGHGGQFGTFFQGYLDRHGEGLQSVILRVDDLERAQDRAVRAGSRLLGRIVLRGDEPFAHRYDQFVEVPLDPIGGTHLTIAQIDRKPAFQRLR